MALAERTNVATLEQALQISMSASLLYEEKARPTYIALRLLHELDEDYDVVDLLSPSASIPLAGGPPKDMGAAVASLTELVKAAVNGAVRNREMSIAEGIANHLLLLNHEHGLLGADDDVDEAEAASDGAATPPAPAATDKKSADARPAAMRTMRQALEAKGPQKKVSYARVVLGRQASSVLPAVIGAFQDEAAKRAARLVDDVTIRKAVKEGERIRKKADKQMQEEMDEAKRLEGMPVGIQYSKP